MEGRYYVRLQETTMRALRHAYLFPALFALVCLVALAPAQIARACSLDGVASISVNGNLASITSGTPNKSNLAYWAPFTLIAVAPRDTLTFAENLSNVVRSLPASAMQRPFRWNFGNGATVYGRTAVQYHYATLGWHKITVSYFWLARKQWIAFDSAQIQVVPPGSLWRANLRYTLEHAFETAVRVIVWGLAAALVGLAIWRWRPRSRKPVAPRPDSGL
jgi:hypothetical protein